MELFLSALVTLVVIIDPLGTAAVYGALTASHTPQQAQATARKATLIAAAVLFFFGLLGAALIGQLGISLEAFRIAGGLLLFVTAFRMLMGHHDQSAVMQEKNVYQAGANDSSPGGSDIAVFPLAIPLLSGPGCMTAMILLTNQTPSWDGKALVFVAMLMALAAAYFSMLGVARIMRTLGESGIQIVARLMGILLAALAVQFIADGIKGLNAGFSG